MKRSPLMRRTPFRTERPVQCCGKKTFPTREDAEAALYRITRNPRTVTHPQRVYECKNGAWHLTKHGDRDTGPDKATRRLVWNRDQGRCAVCGEGVKGRVSSVHHRRSRGSGGSSDPLRNAPSNLLLVCGDGTTGCHGWITASPAESLECGYSVSLNSCEATAEVPVMHAVFGASVLLLDDGSVLPVPDWKGAA